MKSALLLEDNATCASMARAILARVGYTLIAHRTSTKGARAACLSKFAVYVIDVSVRATEIGGDGDGLAFARWLRAERPEARIVVWSGADRSAEALELGARFVAKDGSAAQRLAEAIV